LIKTSFSRNFKGCWSIYSTSRRC